MFGIFRKKEIAIYRGTRGVVTAHKVTGASIPSRGEANSLINRILGKPRTPLPTKQFPPVPAWAPTIIQPLDKIAEAVQDTTKNSVDFALFKFGTFVFLADNLTEQQADDQARTILQYAFRAHPDIDPLVVAGNNVLIRYDQPVGNMVLHETIQKHWEEIDRRHFDALTDNECLMTPLGPNKFDDFGKVALFGRCFMFMDGQDPQVVRIVRKSVNVQT